MVFVVFVGGLVVISGVMFVGFVILVCVVVVIAGVIVEKSIACVLGLLRVGLTTGGTVFGVVLDGDAGV